MDQQISAGYTIGGCLSYPLRFLRFVGRRISRNLREHIRETTTAREQLVFEEGYLPPYKVKVLLFFTTMSSVITFLAASIIYLIKIDTVISKMVVSVFILMAVGFLLNAGRAVYRCGGLESEEFIKRFFSIAKWTTILVGWDKQFEISAIKTVIFFVFSYFMWDKSVILRVLLPLSYSVFVMSMVAYYGASFDRYQFVNGFQASFVLPILLECFKEPMFRELKYLNVPLPDVMKQDLKIEPFVVLAYSVPIALGYLIRWTRVINTLAGINQTVRAAILAVPLQELPVVVPEPQVMIPMHLDHEDESVPDFESFRFN